MLHSTILPPLPHPQDVPVHRVDGHLPAVPAQRLTPQALDRRFAAAGLAGASAGLDWPQPHTHRPCAQQAHGQTERGQGQADNAADAVDAAVLIGLVERPGGLAVLLTERSRHLKKHAGQIAFPGGKRDAADADAAHTALREAQEEVGLDPAFVRVFGPLPVHVTGTGFRVTPVVALLAEGFALQPNAHEVQSVFEVPLAFLMNPAHHRLHRVVFNGQVRQWWSMPYAPPGQPQGERFIWGATAGMLRSLYAFLMHP